MAKGTKIEWCDETLNPLGWGCYGPGGTSQDPRPCSYCYAKRFAARNLRNCPLCQQFIPHWHPEAIDKAEQWTKPRRIFWQSMGDLFHDETPEEYIFDVLATAIDTPQHRHIFLTKNPKRIDKVIQHYSGENRGPVGMWDNIWFGTTITNQDDVSRITHLMNVPEGHKFLSIEPLLGEIELPFVLMNYCNVDGQMCNWPDEHGIIEWVIIGQESGLHAKKPDYKWVKGLIDQVPDYTPLFVKNPLFSKGWLTMEDKVCWKQQLPEGLTL